ncbi:MAG: hypothetical protein RL139_907 [Gemmatimonadota bacterium]|jgi:hypothetical protein
MRRHLSSRAAALALATLALAACNQSESTTEVIPPGAAVISSDIAISRTLYKDTTYTLSGFVKVINGATLTIQPGTVIKGDYNIVGSSLFITRGAKIQAVGTAAEPIVFTSSQPAGQRLAGDWGGLIIIGNGIINRADPVIIEGTGTGANNPQQIYSAGTDNADNSGTLKYVRVEFAGYATATDQELNSFTLAAVGSGTTLEYAEAMYGLDDSFEFFGGAVDGRYLVSYESGDDHFDISEGYKGRLQYLIAFQSSKPSIRPGAGNASADPQGIENDGCNGTGCTLGQNSTPFTTPVMANFTLVGTGAGTDIDATSGGYGAILRRGTGGYYVNGVIARWPKGAFGLRDTLSTRVRITDGVFDVRNIYVAESPTLFTTASGGFVLTDSVARNIVRDATTTTASLFTTFTMPATSTASFDWTPSASAPIATGGLQTFSGNMATAAGSYVSGTAYRGAAAPGGTKWWAGWTNYAKN